MSSTAPSVVARTAPHVDPTRPLRILQVVSHFPPDRIGGVGEVARGLHRGLLAAGHDAHVVTSGRSIDDRRVVRVCDGPDRFPIAAGSVVDHAATFDVVHAHHGEGIALFERLRRRSDRPKLLLTLHVHGPHISSANRGDSRPSFRTAAQSLVRDPLKAAFDRRARVVFDATNFISAAGATESLGIEGAADARVIYNGIDLATDYTGEAPPRTGLLYVGTPGRRKGVDLLPPILAAVRAVHPDTCLRIVGFDRNDEPGLAAAFDRCAVGHAVEWIGAIPSGDVTEHYRSAALLVVPSRYEGLPMVILEAGANRLPAVATDVGGTGEIVVDGLTGRLVGPDDAAALARACVQLLDDDDERARFGSRVHDEVVGRFSIDRTVRQYVDLYRELAEDR